MASKKLYKDEQNKKVCGVCAGLARYFNIDVTLIRLAWVLISVFGTCIIGGTIAYIVCACVMNDEPTGYTTYENQNPNNQI